MNNKMRNLTLSAAALAALTLIAPTASAADRGRGRGFESPRQEFREQGRGGRDRNWAPPTRSFGYRNDYGYRNNYGYASRYRAPYRFASGFRFYSAFPGPGYVYIAGYGWVLPPFYGAVWVPPYFDIGGFRVEGFWR